ncbi:MAG: hypothetical protein JJE51_09685 [Thermoanaerobaculia bacterium]|nr:hypothetical protein [Thermoanaerobaculia bacterium]
MAAALVLVAAAARAEDRAQRYESKLVRTITWRGGPISIDHRFGSVSVIGSSDDHILVRSTIRSSEPDLAKKIAVVVTEEGNGVAIRTEFPEGKIKGSKHFSFSIDYRIDVPERALLKVENRFGSIDVTGMKGKSELINSQGSISVRDVDGPVVATNQFGSISISSADGGAILRNQNGSIQARDVDGRIDITNRFGSINLATIGGNATVRNTNGSVDIRDVNGDLDVTNAFADLTVTSIDGSVRATGTNGRMELRDIRGNVTVTHAYGDVELTSVGGSVSVSGQNVSVEGHDIRHNATITSTYGGVKLNDVGGNVSVRASFSPVFIEELGGSVDVQNQNASIVVGGLTGTRCQNIVLRSNQSSIKVRLPEGASYKVTARTAMGRITSRVPIRTSVSTEESLTGVIGGGKCTLDLVNANGSITIE